MAGRAYSNTKAGQPKRTKGSVIMGFNVDAEQCLMGASGYLCAMGIILTRKPCQKLQTDSNIAFLGVPINTETCILKSLVDEVLKPLELKLIQSDPSCFPTSLHSRTKWVEYEVIKSFLSGMPWEKFDNSKEITPNKRLPVVFQTAKEDSP